MDAKEKVGQWVTPKRRTPGAQPASMERGQEATSLTPVAPSAAALPGRPVAPSAAALWDEDAVPSSTPTTVVTPSKKSKPSPPAAAEAAEKGPSPPKATLKVVPASPGSAKLPSRIISQEQEAELMQRPLTHEDNLVPDHCTHASADREAFMALQAELETLVQAGEGGGGVCVGVLYKFDMTNFRKDELMANYFQRPNLLDVILGVAFLPGKLRGKAHYLTLFDDEATTAVRKEEKWDLFVWFLESAAPKVVFGAQELYKHLFRYRPNASPRGVVDPAIGAWLLNPEQETYAFPSLTALYLSAHPEETTPAAGIASASSPSPSPPFTPPPRQHNAKQLFKDLVSCLRLMAVLGPRLRETELHGVLENVEMRLCPILAQMENTGILFDEALIAHHRTALRAHMVELQRETRKEVGHEVDLASPQKVAHLLFTELGLRPPLETSAPRPSTSDATLKQLWLHQRHPVVQLIIDHRRCQKLLTTYSDSLALKAVNMENHTYLFTSWHQIGTATGRLTSTEPNLQNLPREPYVLARPGFFGPGGETRINVRDALCARDGHVLLAADYSQLEMRLLAHFSADPQLLDFFRSGRDIHRLVAARCNGKAPEEVTEEEREHAKRVVYGIVYGMGPRSLSELLEIDQLQAKGFIDTFLAKFPLVRSFLDSAVEEAKDTGYVRTALGRRRLLPKLRSEDGAEERRAERQAVNTKVQGSAADIVKLAMIRAEDDLRAAGLRQHSTLVIQIHDELVYEVHEEQLASVVATLRKALAAPPSLALSVELPVRLYSGRRFGSLHAYHEAEPASAAATTSSAIGSIPHSK